MGTVTATGADARSEVAAAQLPGPAPQARDAAPVLLDVAAMEGCSAATFPGEPEQAMVVRSHIRHRLSGVQSVVDIALSLTSELFNNAVKHSRSGGPGGEVMVAAIARPRCLQIKVTDLGASDGIAMTPHVRPATFEAEGGFGLHMVAAEASRWGTVHDAGRTTVWFELDLPTQQ